MQAKIKITHKKYIVLVLAVILQNENYLKTIVIKLGRHLDACSLHPLSDSCSWK